jgi:hypothetical protein
MPERLDIDEIRRRWSGWEACRDADAADQEDVLALIAEVDRLRAALERITRTREDWAPDIAREALEGDPLCDCQAPAGTRHAPSCRWWRPGNPHRRDAREALEGPAA